jgi:hypothetical protein
MGRIHIPLTVKVVGVSYHPQEVARARAGAEVKIEHDPANPFDSNACAVFLAGGEQLGHLPAAVAARLVNERCENRWRGRVSEVYCGEHAGIAIVIEAADDVCALGVDAPDEDEVLAVVDVRARSGRRLGRLVRYADNKVYVANDSGVEFGYPRELVEVG